MPGRELDRAEVARGLEQEYEGIKAAAGEFCLPDTSLALLRLEDVFDDWRSGEFSRLLYPDERRDQDEIQATAYFRRATYYLMVGELALSLLLENGRQCGRQLRNFPHILLVISTRPPSETEQELILSGRRGPDDACFLTSVNILGTIPTTEALILKGGAGTVTEDFMGRLLGWHKQLMVYLAKGRAVRKGKDMRIERVETGEMLVSEKAHTEEELLDIFMKERATPRHIVGTAWHTAHWASDFQEVARENYRNIDSPRDPDLNLDYVMRESDEIAKAYGSFPGFKQFFEKLTGVRFDSYAKVERTLFKLVMSADQHVYYGTLKKTLRALMSDTGLLKKECEDIVEFMTWRRGRPPLRYPIYVSGLYRYTSYRRLSAARFIQLEELFSEAYRHEDEKGRIFEERCRGQLRNAGLSVYPSRLVVPFQVVPSEVSEELWGNAKTRTDFDVLAKAGRFGLVIECKETKIPYQRLLKRTNLFEKYIIELYYKTLWASGNPEKFRELMRQGSGGEGPFGGVDYLVPLVVTTFPFDVGDSKVPLLTYSELGHVVKSSGRLTVEADEGEEYVMLPGRSEETSVKAVVLPFKATAAQNHLTDSSPSAGDNHV
jgi:hypothetical protein